MGSRTPLWVLAAQKVRPPTTAYENPQQNPRKPTDHRRHPGRGGGGLAGAALEAFYVEEDD